MLRLLQPAAPLTQGRFVPRWREYTAACLQRAPSPAHSSGDDDRLVKRRREVRERVLEGLDGQTSTVVLLSSGLQ